MASHTAGENTASVIPKIADAVAYEANMIEIDRLVKTTKYRHIVGWGKWLGFTPDTVQRELAQAENDDVPIDVVQKAGNRWLRLGDIQNETNRLRVIELSKISTQGETE